MNTTKPDPCTEGPEAAKINKRLGEIGEELAKCRMTPHPQSRALTEELERLKASYREVLQSGA